VAVDETVNSIASASAALVALDGKDVELADDLAEYDRAVAGHRQSQSSMGAPGYPTANGITKAQ
jgi:hypothetical protein